MHGNYIVTAADLENFEKQIILLARLIFGSEEFVQSIFIPNPEIGA